MAGGPAGAEIDLQSGVSSISYAVGAAALLGAMSLMVAAMVGLDRRHGGLGAIGAAGLVAAGLGLAGSLLAWVFTGWGSLTMIGTLLFATALWGRDIAPRVPTLLFAAGPIIGASAWAALRERAGSIDLTGLWGERWIENEVGLTVGGASSPSRCWFSATGYDPRSRLIDVPDHAATA